MRFANITIDPAVFSNIRDYLRDKIGIYFGDNKAPFLEKRLRQRMEDLEIQDFNEYFHALRFADRDGHELQKLTNLVTTNETYMFREYEQLEAFANHCIAIIYDRKKESGDRSIRIWSAGCSSGEEPYTLSIILKEILEDYEDWDIQILATDIDEKMLHAAKTAVYSDRSVKQVPREYFDRHLVPTGDGYLVREGTKEPIEFRHLNLNDRRAIRKARRFDVIFCRNVLIYFDDEARKSVVDHFYTALNAGGYIFLGHSESVGRITTAFRLERLGNHLVYSKS